MSASKSMSSLYRGIRRAFALLMLVSIALMVTGSTLAQPPIPLPPSPNSSQSPAVKVPQAAPKPLDIWVVEVAAGVDAHAVAAQTGMQYLSPVGDLAGYHLFRSQGVKTASPTITAMLTATAGVRSARQQFAYPVEFADLSPNDPDFPNSWHLQNTGQDSHGNGGGTPGEDVSVQAAWDPDGNPATDDGYSGSGVIVGVIDDGIQYTHPDIQPNYRTDLDYDYSDFDDDGVSVPGYDEHGQSVSGIIGAVQNNGKCSTGIAYEADLASLRLLGGTYDYSVTFDAAGAGAFSHQINQIDLYSNSWGYNGALSFANELPLQGLALQFGATHGRGGLGNIYVFATGNAGHYGISTNHSPLLSSRYTIPVGGSNYDGQVVWYSTRGSSVMVNAPTAGGSDSQTVQNGIFTTDMLGDYGYNDGSDSAVAGDDPDCTSNFNGTSAATPNASGVIALIVEANPNLTWRDVQHILVETSTQNDPNAEDADAWQTNAAGYSHSHAYGFGRVNAGEAVAAAETWENVPTEVMYEAPVQVVNQVIPDYDETGITLNYEVSAGLLPANFVVEHVVAQINLPHSWAGDVQADLTSPSGVVSHLLTPTYSVAGFGGYLNNFPLLTVANWGESAADLTGTWTFHVADILEWEEGILQSWHLVFYGYLEGAPNPLAAPSLLTATATTETSVDLAWQDNATSETGYVVERTTTPENTESWTVLNTLGVDAVSYSDTGLTTCTAYYYRVYATDGTDQSAPSNVALAHPQFTNGCPTPELTLLTPAENTYYNVVGAPPIKFSTTGDLKSFKVIIEQVNDSDTTSPVFVKKVKAAGLGDYCANGICKLDIVANQPDFFLKNGSYTIKIKVKYTDGSHDATSPVPFEIRTPSAPELVNPHYGQVFQSMEGLTDFTWKPSINAENYRFILTKDDNHNTVVYKLLLTATSTPSVSDICTAEACVLPITGDLKAAIEAQIANTTHTWTDFRWTVTARNKAGKSKSYSYFSYYQPGGGGVTVPYIQSPNNTSIPHPADLSFVWRPGSADTQYRLQMRLPETETNLLDVVIDAASTPNIVTVCSNSDYYYGTFCMYTPTEAVLGFLTDGASYQWRLKYVSSEQNGATGWANFTFKLHVPVPSANLPVPNAVTIASPLFGWTMANTADEYTLTIIGENYLLTDTFTRQEICQSSTYYAPVTCSVNFNSLPGTGAIILLPAGEYDWSVTAATGALSATSASHHFTVVEGAVGSDAVLGSGVIAVPEVESSLSR